jgi:hypothetical protein
LQIARTMPPFPRGLNSTSTEVSGFKANLQDKNLGDFVWLYESLNTDKGSYSGSANHRVFPKHEKGDLGFKPSKTRLLSRLPKANAPISGARLFLCLWHISSAGEEE